MTEPSSSDVATAPSSGPTLVSSDPDIESLINSTQGAFGILRYARGDQGWVLTTVSGMVVAIIPPTAIPHYASSLAELICAIQNSGAVESTVSMKQIDYIRRRVEWIHQWLGRLDKKSVRASTIKAWLDQIRYLLNDAEEVAN